MNDMSATIVAKSDQINAVDLIGADRTFTIREVRIKEGDDQPVSIFFEGENKAFRPCKGVRRLLVHVWGLDAAKYVGQSLTLFHDPKVTWAGKEEGGIRVSRMTGIAKKITFVMRISRAATRPYEIEPLTLAVQTQPDPDAAMREWAAKFTARIATADTPDAVNALVAKQTAWLDKLPADLRAQCDAAVSDRLAALSPGEGRADTDHGDQHDDLPDNF